MSWSQTLSQLSTEQQVCSPEAPRLLIPRKSSTQRKSSFLIDFGNLNFHQCKHKFLLPALRLIGTTFCLCIYYSATFGLILASELRTQRTAFLLQKCPLQGQENYNTRKGKGIMEEAKVIPHLSPLPASPDW